MLYFTIENNLQPALSSEKCFPRIIITQAHGSCVCMEQTFSVQLITFPYKYFTATKVACCDERDGYVNLLWCRRLKSYNSGIINWFFLVVDSTGGGEGNLDRKVNYDYGEWASRAAHCIGEWFISFLCTRSRRNVKEFYIKAFFQHYIWFKLTTMMTFVLKIEKLICSCSENI